MATRKILSVLTVLLLVTSGLALTAFAGGPLPAAETEGAEIVDGFTITFPENAPSEDENILINQMTGEPVNPDNVIQAPADVREAYKMDMFEVNFDELLNMPMGREGGGTLIRGDSNHRAPGDILLIDDDASSHVNTTQAFNNSGPYDMDTGKILSDALTNLGYDFDTFIVDAGFNGPDFATMDDYKTIIWSFGYEWGFYPTLTQWDFWRIINFMEMGGSVWFSGPGFLSSIYGNANYTVGGQNEFDSDGFAMKHLGIEEFFWFTGQPDVVNGSAGPVMTGSEQYNTRNWFNQFGDQTDILGAITRPVSSGFEILIADGVDAWDKSYNDEPVAVGYNSGTWKVVTAHLDFSVISSATDREDYIGKVMSWLGTPTLNTNRVNLMNMNVTVEDQSPTWSADHNFVYWGALLFDQTTGQFIRIFPQVRATVHTHELFSFTSNFENHGPAANNAEIRFIVSDAMGKEVDNFTKTASVGRGAIGSVSGDFTPTRSGFYSVWTNISYAPDVYAPDNALRSVSWIKVAEWLDDLENGTSEWSSEGAWSLSSNAQHYNTPSQGWYWSKTGTTDADGDDLVTPTVDMRFYNTSFDHDLFQPDPNFIFFHFLFKGRMRGTGQDYVDLLFKASNMTTWSSLIKIDGNTPGANNVPGDFESDWWRFTQGIYMGPYAGQTVEFKWNAVKRNPTSDSWWAVDDFIVWMAHERNVAPWFIERHPDAVDFEVDVGDSFDLRVLAEDPTFDEPITYEWLEDYVTIPGEDTNMTSFDIPRTVASGHKYERGNVLEIVCNVRDDELSNGTLWKIHLLDPRPVATLEKPDFIEINEDEATDVDMGTASNVKWFEDVEGQDFTVTSAGSQFIDVTNGANNVLTFVNKLPNWNGVDNVTLKVQDSAGSMRNFTLEVRVIPVNDAPKWKDVLLPDGEQDTFYSYNLTATDADNDLADLVYSTDATFFTMSGASSEIAFKPTNDNVGYNYFNVTVEDPDGLTDTMELVLFVQNVNDPPEIRYIDPQVITEDEPWSFDVSTYVDDPDLLLPEEFRDRITYRDDTTKLDTNVETGVITWTPTNDDVGDHFFTITVTDTKGRSDQQEIKITVENAPDAPVPGLIGKQNLVQGRDYEFTVPVTDEDMDAPGVNEVLTFQSNQPDLFTIDAATGRIDFTPDNEHVGAWTVTITITDSFGLSASVEVIFDIENENDKPTIEYIPAQQLTEDVPFSLQIVADDPDMDERLLDGEQVDPDEQLTYRTNNTRVLIDNDGLLTFTPTNDDAKHRTMVVRITVVDASSETATVDVTFAITGVNDPPEKLQIIGIVEGQKIDAGKKITLRGSALDIDDDADKLVYRWYAGTTLIGQTQDITWKVKGKGNTPIKLVVADAEQAETELAMNITIREVDEGPGFEMVFVVAAIGIIAILAIVDRRRRM
ncbi:MAG: tandem-95 repeat protein [Thermoplasmata archaeon]|nr:MAG: tandem-95 repeat protein [Thermoplasmata archaeon]